MSSSAPRPKCPAGGGRSARTLGVMKLRPSSIALSLLLAGTLAPSVASPKPQETGLFSNMRYVPQAGDVVGAEIFVIYDGGAYQALVQCAEGRMGQAQLLPAVVAFPDISFTIPPDSPTLCPRGEFKGRLLREGIRGTIHGLSWPGFLPRRRSYWQ